MIYIAKKGMLLQHMTFKLLIFYITFKNYHFYTFLFLLIRSCDSFIKRLNYINFKIKINHGIYIISIIFIALLCCKMTLKKCLSYRGFGMSSLM